MDDTTPAVGRAEPSDASSDREQLRKALGDLAGRPLDEPLGDQMRRQLDRLRGPRSGRDRRADAVVSGLGSPLASTLGSRGVAWA